MFVKTIQPLFLLFYCFRLKYERNQIIDTFPEWITSHCQDTRDNHDSVFYTA